MKLTQVGYNLNLDIKGIRFTKVVKDKETRDNIKKVFSGRESANIDVDYFMDNSKISEKMSILEQQNNELKKLIHV